MSGTPIDDLVARAQLAAVISVRDSNNIIPRRTAVELICEAVIKAAQQPRAFHGTTDQAHYRLTVAGECAYYQACAGVTQRETLIKRIEALPPEQKYAYSLRVESGMSDWQIAEAMNTTEDDVVTLILKALMALAGVAHGS